MANIVHSVDSGSSFGNPIHNSTPKKSSFIERHNQSAGLFEQGVISDKQNVSLEGYSGTVNLNILSDTSNDDLREIERLNKKFQTGQQKLRQVEALKEALANKQDDLQQRITPLNTEVREQETQVRNITRKYKVMQKKYESSMEMFGMTDPDDAEKYVGAVKKLSPALDELQDLSDKQQETLDGLYKKLEELTEEKQSFTWKNAIEKEQDVHLKSERYFDTLNSAVDKSTLRLEKQGETIKELQEEIEAVDEENEKLAEAARLKQLQEMCNELDAKLKAIVQSNEELKRKNSQLASQNRKAPITVAPQSAPSTQQKCHCGIKSQLNTAYDKDATILDNDATIMPGNASIPVTEMTVIPETSNRSHTTVMDGISVQVDDVKKEVASMKEVLRQSKEALQGLLPKTQAPGASRVLNKTTDAILSGNRRQRIKQRLNRTH